MIIILCVPIFGAYSVSAWMRSHTFLLKTLNIIEKITEIGIPEIVKID